MLIPDTTDRRGPLDTVYVGSESPTWGLHVVADGCEVPWPTHPFGPQPYDRGFHWGSRGTGAEALAWALLYSATRGNGATAGDLYQRYERDVVRDWGRWWVTTRAAILRWIGEQPGHLDGRESADEGGEP